MTLPLFRPCVTPSPQCAWEPGLLCTTQDTAKWCVCCIHDYMCVITLHDHTHVVPLHDWLLMVPKAVM